MSTSSHEPETSSSCQEGDSREETGQEKEEGRGELLWWGKGEFSLSRSQGSTLETDSIDLLIALVWSERSWRLGFWWSRSLEETTKEDRKRFTCRFWSRFWLEILRTPTTQGIASHLSHPSLFFYHSLVISLTRLSPRLSSVLFLSLHCLHYFTCYTVFPNRTEPNPMSLFFLTLTRCFLARSSKRVVQKRNYNLLIRAVVYTHRRVFSSATTVLLSSTSSTFALTPTFPLNSLSNFSTISFLVLA